MANWVRFIGSKYQTGKNKTGLASACTGVPGTFGFSAKVCACRLAVLIRTAIKRSRRRKRKGTGEEGGVECWKSFSCGVKGFRRCKTARGLRLRSHWKHQSSTWIPNSVYECGCWHFILPFIFLNLSNVGSRWQQAVSRMFKASFTAAAISNFSWVPQCAPTPSRDM